MTEHDWGLLTSTEEVYDELSAVLQPRKLFLLAAAFLGRVREHLPDEDNRRAVDATLDYAQGNLPVRELLIHWTNAEVSGRHGLWIGPNSYIRSSWCPCCEEWDEKEIERLGGVDPRAHDAAHHPAWVAAQAAIIARGCKPALEGEWLAQYRLVWDIIGDPHQPARPAPDWARTSRAIRDLLGVLDGADQDIEPLSLFVLADAMEEAGCQHRAALAHCRADRPHGPHCWVIEWLQGREMIEVPVDEADRWPRWDF